MFLFQKHILSVQACAIVMVLVTAAVDDALARSDGTSASMSESRAHNVDAINAEVYGAAWNADDLANINLGKWGQEVSFRIRAERTGQVSKLRYYDMHGESGYSGGDGGDVRIELQTDDETPAHCPSGTVLASGFIGEPLKDNAMKIRVC